MIDAIWMVSVSRCASATLCPTDRDLLSAVRRRDGEIAVEIAKADMAKGSPSLEIIDLQKIRDISNVHCGDSTTAAPKSVNCSFTLKYWSSICYTVAKMTLGGDGWVISDDLSVSRGPK